MATRPMSEKAAEILFNRYMLQSFGLGGAQLFAPSSIEEFKNGYDAKIVGFSPLREIYLQFKAPDFLERNQRFTIRTTPHQHALLKSYPARAAYYVSAMFHSMEQMNQAQAILKTAEDFLKDFECVEVSCLPPDVRSIHYSRPENHRIKATATLAPARYLWPISIACAHYADWFRCFATCNVCNSPCVDGPVGKDFLHVAGLVGAAMCSAY